jgi:hypothetical protein
MQYNSTAVGFVEYKELNPLHSFSRNLLFTFAKPQKTITIIRFLCWQNQGENEQNIAFRPFSLKIEPL